MRKQTLGKRPSPLIVTMVLCLFLLIIDGSALPLYATTQESYEKLKIFSDVLTIIKKNYVDDINNEEVIYNSIKGMVSNLDPHSSFMTPDLYKELQVETKGRFGGLGIEITMKDGILTVVSPIEDTPAFRAGIKTGDQIIKIKDEPTKSMTLMDAVKRMRGTPGTKITITVLRKGISEPKVFTVIRDIIKIRSVKHDILEDDFGYIRITQFQENTVQDFKKALSSVEAGETALKGLVLDLRGNPGGLLDQAVKISDEFLDAGLIVYTEGRIESQKMQFHAKKNETRHEYPIVVLVNAGSASASEIVAGALQDHGKAVIVGTQTFGKGTVQTIFPLDDGSGLRITTAKYYTPSHRSIQEKGITPDIIVEDSVPEASSTEKIKYIREKDLKNHFKAVEDDGAGAADESNKENSQEKSSDPPLDTAINILKSWDLFQKTLNRAQNS